MHSKIIEKLNNYNLKTQQTPTICRALEPTQRNGLET